MRAIRVCVAAVASLMILLAKGCGAPDDSLTASTVTTATAETSLPDPQAGVKLKAELESIGSFATAGGNYDTGHKLPDPPGSQRPAEAALGRLSLSFHDGKIREQVSDYWNEWTYDVDADGTIRAYDRKGNLAMTGEYDSVSGQVLFNGRRYVPAGTAHVR